MAASHLVTCEARFTLPAAEGALAWRIRSQKPVLLLRASVKITALWCQCPHYRVVAVRVFSATSILRRAQTLVYVVTDLEITGR